MNHPTRLTFIASILASLLTAASAEAGRIHPGHCKQGKPTQIIKSRNGSGAPVHPSAAKGLQCILDGLDNARSPISFVYGYACRSLPTSNHPRGLAIDVNQHSRDVTRPTVPRQKGKQIAAACGMTSGAEWNNPDNGHFEVRSMGRRQQAQRRPQTRQPAPRPPRHWYNPNEFTYHYRSWDQGG